MEKCQCFEENYSELILALKKPMHTYKMQQFVSFLHIDKKADCADIIAVLYTK